MAIKKTLLEIVQEILNDIDGEEVNSISDSIEAQQIASIVETVFYDLISTRDIPEHFELLKLTSLSSSSTPTHFEYPDNVKRIDKLWYDTSTDDTFKYTEVRFMDPKSFLDMCDSRSSNYDSVLDVHGGTTLRIANNKKPEYYTSLDDEHVIMDSYVSTQESTLKTSKVRAYGVKYPVFDKTSDTYKPDIDEVLYPLLIAEAKSTAFSVLKGQVDPKIEQNARRQRNFAKDDKYRNNRGNEWPRYGRR